MKNFKLGIISILAILVLSGCGDKVTVDSGRVAKQLGTNGLEAAIRRAGAFRLDSCITTACPRFVVLDVFENTQTIASKYYISASKLNLELEVDIQYAVKEDDTSINKVYKRVKSVPVAGERKSIITTEQVFNTYIKPVSIGTIRTALNHYDIDNIMDNLSEVQIYVEKAFKEKLKDEPVIIKSLTFSLVSYPKVIVERREEEASVDAEKATKLKRLAADLIVLKERRKLDLEHARVAVEADKIISDSMDEHMATWLMLEAIQACAERTVGNCNIDIHPALLPSMGRR
ncbi:MAG: hypothetical protein DRQ46_09660 [Gammaproteobacteria bacterium]|nr:MAG: hypothetical protein DRQ46_09660 [Gammaproteobacteria bacterium]